MRLSVIVPGYNTPVNWWRRCVGSVLKAIGPEDELIVMDDGSDKKWEVDGGWWLDKRVRVVRKENGGLSSARNAALEIARGRYVTFVDSDDEVEPETFDQCLMQLEKMDADIAVYGVRVIWVGDGLAKEDVPAFDIQGRMLKPADVKALYDGCLLNYAWNKVYRRSFLEKNRLRFDRDGMPCEDIIFNLSCILAGATFCMVPHVGYVYYRTRGTLLSMYKQSGKIGLMIADKMWKRYKAENPGAQDVLGNRGEMTDDARTVEDWRNIWLTGSPFGMVARWTWLNQHPQLGGAGAFAKMMLFMLVRRYFYFRPFRRMHTKRLFPNVRDWQEDRRRWK